MVHSLEEFVKRMSSIWFHQTGSHSLNEESAQRFLMVQFDENNMGSELAVDFQVGAR